MDEHINFRLKATERELRRCNSATGSFSRFSRSVAGCCCLEQRNLTTTSKRSLPNAFSLWISKIRSEWTSMLSGFHRLAVLRQRRNTKTHLVVDGDPEGGGYLSFLSRNAQSNVRLTMGAKGENSLSLFYKDKQSVWLGSSKETKDTKLGLSNDQISLIVQPDGICQD